MSGIHWGSGRATTTLAKTKMVQEAVWELRNGLLDIFFFFAGCILKISSWKDATGQPSFLLFLFRQLPGFKSGLIQSIQSYSGGILIVLSRASCMSHCFSHSHASLRLARYVLYRGRYDCESERHQTTSLPDFFTTVVLNWSSFRTRHQP